jgi:hypothetical protein
MRTWLRSFVDTILGKVPGKASLPLALGGMTQCGISLVLPLKITDHSCPRPRFFQFTRHTHENRCRILLVNSLILSSQLLDLTSPSETGLLQYILLKTPDRSYPRVHCFSSLPDSNARNECRILLVS